MKLFTWGANSHGQLSHGVQSEQCLCPTEVVALHGVVEVTSVSAGGGHTLLLDTEGALFGSGSNNNGQLADLANSTTVLSKLKALQEFKLTKVECGWESSFAITECGSVMAWGSNKFGQLGVPKEKVTITKHPVVLDIPNVTQIAAGLRHTALVSSEGYVYMCGSSSRGQLGVLQSDGSVPKKDYDSFVRVGGLERVVQVACGQHHSLALTADGRLYGWGDNRRGQLGERQSLLPTPHLLMTCQPGACVRAGWTHSAVLSGGTVTSWGRNSYNQLGHSDGQEQATLPTQVSGLSSVKQLELGAEHNLALLDSGEVWSWGWNEHGNCGTGTVDNVEAPVLLPIPYEVNLIAAGGGHSLALKQD